MANSFKIAEQFVAHLRLHRGRAAVNQGQLAKNFGCSTDTLRTWIKHMMEAGVVNRSPHSVPDGVEYWFIDWNAMMGPQWLDLLHAALKMAMAGSQRVSLGKKFALLNDQIREIKESVEQEVSALKQENESYKERVKELEKELSTEKFERNKDAVLIRELEMANRELVATANFHERRAATAITEV